MWRLGVTDEGYYGSNLIFYKSFHRVTLGTWVLQYREGHVKCYVFWGTIRGWDKILSWYFMVAWRCPVTNVFLLVKRTLLVPKLISPFYHLIYRNYSRFIHISFLWYFTAKLKDEIIAKNSKVTTFAFFNSPFYCGIYENPIFVDL